MILSHESMISHLHLQNIGPVESLDANFGQRLNVVTGDNGLGKTFLLDACWYSLTKRNWVENRPFIPKFGTLKNNPPKIEYALRGEGGLESKSYSVFDYPSQVWKGKPGRPPKPGLVLYARIDGGFSVWDPARNYWRDTLGVVESADLQNYKSDVPKAYQFTKKEIWNGLKSSSNEDSAMICNGLLRDVETWQLKKNRAFDLLQSTLAKLSSSKNELLQFGESIPVNVGDDREIPTLIMPYGKIPVTQAAAGVRRVLALSYLLVWAWEAHLKASNLKLEPPTRNIVLLFDEVEAHLHPKWQRVFLPCLLDVVESLVQSNSSLGEIQMIVTTHAPLVLASVETMWNNEQDQLFDFDLYKNKVTFNPIAFRKHGSVENWLTSESFDLTSGYSIEAQEAITQANQLMATHKDPKSAPKASKEKLHAQLLKTLGGDDEYWPLWLPYYNTESI